MGRRRCSNIRKPKTNRFGRVFRYRPGGWDMSFYITDRCVGCTLCAKKCPEKAISGFRKERHLVDPSKCIDCGLCSKVCPSDAIIDGDGNQRRHLPKEEWKKPRFVLSLCVGCAACHYDCPASCIGMKAMNPEEPKTFFPFLTDPDACSGCERCREICPSGAVQMTILPL